MNKNLALLRPGIVLLIVAAAAALILGGVSLATSGRIDAIAQEKMDNAMRAVLPGGSYTPVEVPAGFADVDAIYASSTGGWVVQTTETGSQGLVTMMVGVDPQYICTGVSITGSSETAGLGAVASQSSEKGEAFRAQFVGLSGTVSVTKEGGSVDAISGATITSRAICRGVTSALEACRALGSAGTGAVPPVPETTTIISEPVPTGAPYTALPPAEGAPAFAELPGGGPSAAAAG